MRRLALLALLYGASAALQAEPPISRFANAQLELAQSELDAAQAALQKHDQALVRQLAAQAQFDARLAWRMTESVFIRRGALEVTRTANRLRAQGMEAGAKATPAS